MFSLFLEELGNTRESYQPKRPLAGIRKVFFLTCAVGLWVLWPLLAYCTNPR
jgi:hypothetical protein